MIKAIFLDIDGTLVSFKTHRISQATLDALARERSRGTKIFIATGRPLPFVDNLDQLQYDGIITVNGASCKTTDGIIINHDPICKDDLRQLVSYYEARPFPIAFASDDEVYITETISQQAIDVLNLLNIKVPQQRPITACLDMDIMQLVAFFTTEEEPHIMQHILPHCSAQRWHPAFADVINQGNNKSKGIDKVLAYYGISLAETAAFGDGGNDISMLSHVGIGVAMGNARDAVKQAAKYITDTVDNDGIAQFLKKYGN